MSAPHESTPLPAAATAHAARPSLLQHGLLLILATLAMCLPMLVLYAFAALGAAQNNSFNPARIGLLISTCFAAAALLSPWVGQWVQHHGERRSLRQLFLALGTGFALLACAGENLYLPLLALLPCACAQAICNPATNLLLARHFPPPWRARAAGIKQAGVQFAALLAGACMLPLAQRFGWQQVFAALLPLALLLAAWCEWGNWGQRVQLPPQAGAQTRLKMAWRIPPPPHLLAWLMAAQCLCGFLLSSFVSLIPQYARHLQLNPEAAAGLLLWFGASGLLARIVLTPQAKRLGDETRLLIILLGVACLALLLLLQARPQSAWLLHLAALLLGCSAVASNAIAMGMLLADQRFGAPAQAAGWLSCAFFGGFALGPLLCGLVLNRFGASAWPWLWLGLLAGSLCALFPFLQLLRLRSIKERI